MNNTGLEALAGRGGTLPAKASSPTGFPYLFVIPKRLNIEVNSHIQFSSEEVG
jgi:hypothetical protein